jgi:hypothetical protein
MNQLAQVARLDPIADRSELLGRIFGAISRHTNIAGTISVAFLDRNFPASELGYQYPGKPALREDSDFRVTSDLALRGTAAQNDFPGLAADLRTLFMEATNYTGRLIVTFRAEPEQPSLVFADSFLSILFEFGASTGDGVYEKPKGIETSESADSVHGLATTPRRFDPVRHQEQIASDAADIVAEYSNYNGKIFLELSDSVDTDSPDGTPVAGFLEIAPIEQAGKAAPSQPSVVRARDKIADDLAAWFGKSISYRGEVRLAFIDLPSCDPADFYYTLEPICLAVHFGPFEQPSEQQGRRSNVSKRYLTPEIVERVLQSEAAAGITPSASMNPLGHKLDPIEDSAKFLLFLHGIINTAAPYKGAITVDLVGLSGVDGAAVATTRLHRDSLPYKIPDGMMIHALPSINHDDAREALAQMFEAALTRAQILDYEGDMIVYLDDAAPREQYDLTIDLGKKYTVSIRFGPPPALA